MKSHVNFKCIAIGFWTINCGTYQNKILSCSDELSDYQIDNSTLGMFNKSTFIKINQGVYQKLYLL